MKASIVIANYNNARFINECIKSLYAQTFKNYEIIFFDDNSKDNSIQEIEKFKNVKVIKNKTQTKFGSLNQMNAFYKSIETSTGDIIFFLDSDDYFHEKKLEKVMKFFIKNHDKQIVFDNPILVKKNMKFEKHVFRKKRYNYWGYIHPTSCISVRKKFIFENYKLLTINDYHDIWMDLRILIYSKFFFDNYSQLTENLTYYRQTEENISSKFKKYSKNWWLRRSQAHNFLFYISKIKNIKIKKNLDYFLTKIVCYLIK